MLKRIFLISNLSLILLFFAARYSFPSSPKLRVISLAPSTTEILFALGLDEDIAGKIILYRAGQDGVEGTLDDNVFVSSSEIVPRLAQVYPFSAAQIEQLNRVAALFLVVRSNNFLIRATAKLSGRNSLVVSSVVKRDGKILYWREN